MSGEVYVSHSQSFLEVHFRSKYRLSERAILHRSPNPLSARRWRSGAFDHLEEILEASKVQRVSQQSSRFPKTARTNVNTTNNCTCFVSIGTCTLQCTTLPITALFHKRSLTMKNHWTSDVIDIFKHRARFRESGPVNCLQLELHHHLDTCQLSTDIISCLSC